MFDIAWSEMIVIGAVALIAIGPKDLPKALRAVGAMTAKARRMASEFQDHFREAMREAELDSIKQEVANINKDLTAATSGLHDEFNSIGQEMPAAPKAPLQISGEATELDIPGLVATTPAASPGADTPAPTTPVETAPATTLSVEAKPGSVTVTETAMPPTQEKPARKKRAPAKPKTKPGANGGVAAPAGDDGTPSLPGLEAAQSAQEPDKSETSQSQVSKSEPSKFEPSKSKSPRKRVAKPIPSGDDRAA